MALRVPGGRNGQKTAQEFFWTPFGPPLASEEYIVITTNDKHLEFGTDVGHRAI
jgi:hypothetical protein